MFELSDKQYNVSKSLVTVVSPAFITLYVTLGQVWEWSGTEKVTATVAAVTLFAGVLLKISSAKFNANASETPPAI